MTGLVAAEPPQQSRPQGEKRNPVIRMDEERIALAKIEEVKVGPANIATRPSVPAVIAPDADRVAHLSGTVAELRKNIGDKVENGEILGALESREVADAKSEYMRATIERSAAGSDGPRQGGVGQQQGDTRATIHQVAECSVADG